jgi:predicted ester cyclase
MSPAMTTADTTATANKNAIRKLYESCINQARTDCVGEVISDDYVGLRGERGPAGFAATVVGLRAGFPDIQFTLEDLVADGDRVAVRWTWHATHSGTFVGPLGSFPATGKPISNTGMAIYQLADHKVIRNWLETDRLGALQQMGILSPTGAPAAAQR